MTRNIYLMGEMGRLFGEKHRLNVKTVQEATHAIDCMKGGLRRYILECQDKGIEFSVQKGSEILENDEANAEHFLNETELQGPEGRGLDLENNDIIITPIPQGSLKGVFKAIIGLVLVVLAIMNPMGWASGGWALAALASTGMMLATMGIVEMMMPDDPDKIDEQKSTLFNGPVNTTKPGVPVPIAYGKTIVGGAVVNFGFTRSRVKSQQGWDFYSSANNPAGDGNIDAGGSSGPGGNGSGHDDNNGATDEE